jgi:transcriptional regulator of acetoin/glycerol metabolism
VLLADRSVLEPSDLRLEESGFQATPATPGPAARTLEEVERAHVERTLAECGGNVVDAAGILGLSRSALYDRLRRYGLSAGAAGGKRGGR